MKYFKIDWVLPGLVLAPIVVLIAMMGAASFVWIRNSITQAELISRAIDNEPELTSCTSEAETRRVRLVHELMVSSTHQQAWSQSILTSKQWGSLHRNDASKVSPATLELLDQLSNKFVALETQLADLTSEPDFPVEDCFPGIFHYSSLEYGQINSSPLWLFQSIFDSNFVLAVGNENKDDLFQTLTSAFELMLPKDGEPMSWNTMVYFPTYLSRTRIVAGSGVLSNEQYAELDQVLQTPIDWEASWRNERTLKSWLIGELLKHPEVFRKSPQLIRYPRGDRKRTSRDESIDSLAPSEVLAMARQWLPPMDLQEAIKRLKNSSFYDSDLEPFQGIDQWLGQSQMSHFPYPRMHQRGLVDFAATIRKTQTDILFARASLAIARLKGVTEGIAYSGQFPISFAAFAKVGWNRTEITEAGESLVLLPTPDGVTLESRGAAWMKDGDGKILDGGFSKQVVFK